MSTHESAARRWPRSARDATSIQGGHLRSQPPHRPAGVPDTTASIRLTTSLRRGLHRLAAGTQGNNLTAAGRTEMPKQWDASRRSTRVACMRGASTMPDRQPSAGS